MVRSWSRWAGRCGCWPAGTTDRALAASRPFVAGELRTPDTRWTSEVRATPVAGEPDALDLAITFKLAEGMAKSAGVAVAFDFADWSTNNYVLIPASVYNGNRNRIEYRGYCTGFNPEDFYNKDLPVTHGDVPRLELEPGKPSKIEVNASNATTPAMCFYNPQAKRAFIVLAEQGIRAGGQILDNGLMIEESADRSRATLVVSAPGVRERKPEFIGFSASPDRGIDWKAGKEVTLRLRVYSFASPDIAGLLEKFMSVRKAVTGPNHPRNLIPFSEVIRLMTGRIDSHWHEGAAGQYYCPENSDNLCLGWIGGLMNTFPMLALGDEMHRERVTKTFDFAIPAAQGKSGYFLATVHPDGKASGRDWFPNQPIVLTRQNADVLYWMIKQFTAAQGAGPCRRHQACMGTSRETAGTGVCEHLETSRPMGQLCEPRDRRHRHLQFHQRRHGHRRTGLGLGVFQRAGISGGRPRRPPTIITTRTSSRKASPMVPAPTSCRTPTRRPPPVS